MSKIHQKKYTAKDIQKLLNKEFEESLKPLGKDLVDNGFLKYNKLTRENYYYWWCEVENLEDIDKNQYTYDLKNLEFTKKTEYLQKFINYFPAETNSWKVLFTVLEYIMLYQENSKDITTGWTSREEANELFASVKNNKLI